MWSYTEPYGCPSNAHGKSYWQRNVVEVLRGGLHSRDGVLDPRVVHGDVAASRRLIGELHCDGRSRRRRWSRRTGLFRSPTAAASTARWQGQSGRLSRRGRSSRRAPALWAASPPADRMWGWNAAMLQPLSPTRLTGHRSGSAQSAPAGQASLASSVVAQDVHELVAGDDGPPPDTGAGGYKHVSVPVTVPPLGYLSDVHLHHIVGRSRTRPARHHHCHSTPQVRAMSCSSRSRPGSSTSVQRGGRWRSR